MCVACAEKKAPLLSFERRRSRLKGGGLLREDLIKSFYVREGETEREKKSNDNKNKKKNTRRVRERDNNTRTFFHAHGHTHTHTRALSIDPRAKTHTRGDP